jgi:hypothetical protein
VSRGWLLAFGWFALVADYVYWMWQLGRSEDVEISSLHAWLNAVLYFASPVLFLVLVVFTVVWLNGRGRTER